MEGMCGRVQLFTFNNSVDNLIRALCTRVLYCKINGTWVTPPNPTVSLFHRFRRFARFIDSFAMITSPMQLDDVPLHYKGADRLRKQRAVGILRTTGYLPKYAKVDAFTKAELYDRSKKEPHDTDVRLIQPRSQEHLCYIARYIIPIEKKFYRAIDKTMNLFQSDPSPTVMKGYNIQQIAGIARQKWDSYSRPVAIGGDASRFDESCRKDSLKWLRDRYLKYYHGSDVTEFRQLLTNQIGGRGVGKASDGVVFYTTTGGKSSGDMDTSMTGCGLMCAMVSCYMHALKIRRYSLLNNGDDFVIICDAADANKITSTNMHDYFLECGFRVAMEPHVTTFEQIQFCKMQPVYTGERWTMCRNPHVAITKDATSIRPHQSFSDYVGWLACVGMGGIAACAGIPMLQAYYQCFVRNATKLKQDHPNERVVAYVPPKDWTWKQNRIASLAPTPHIITDDARVSFYRAFGILPDIQVLMERYYEQHSLSWKGLHYYGDPQGVWFA